MVGIDPAAEWFTGGEGEWRYRILVAASSDVVYRMSADWGEMRSLIGREFIAVFAEEAQKLQRGEAHDKIAWLVQGTLYPDVIESVSVKGPSATIKTHHNVGGLPENMPFALIEPLRDLFKDEVRRIAKDLGLPDEILLKHPFPGPGLAVRLLGEITREHLHTLQEADAVVRFRLKKDDNSSSLSRMASPFWSMPSWQLAR